MANERSVNLEIEAEGATHSLTRLADTFDGATFHSHQFTVPGGSTAHWKFRVYSPDTLNQSSSIQFSLSGANPLTCVSVLAYFAVVHESGAYYELTPKPGG